MVRGNSNVPPLRGSRVRSLYARSERRELEVATGGGIWVAAEGACRILTGML